MRTATPCGRRMTVGGFLLSFRPSNASGEILRVCVSVTNALCFNVLNPYPVTLSGAANGHEPRSRTGLARKRISGQTLFCRVRNDSPFYTRSLCSVARFSRSLDQDDKGGVNILQYIQNFTFTIQSEILRLARLSPCSLRMTGGGIYPLRSSG